MSHSFLYVARSSQSKAKMEELVAETKLGLTITASIIAFRLDIEEIWDK